jgi:hypothetical protein
MHASVDVCVHARLMSDVFGKVGKYSQSAEGKSEKWVVRKNGRLQFEGTKIIKSFHF